MTFIISSSGTVYLVCDEVPVLLENTVVTVWCLWFWDVPLKLLVSVAGNGMRKFCHLPVLIICHTINSWTWMRNTACCSTKKFPDPEHRRWEGLCLFTICGFSSFFLPFFLLLFLFCFLFVLFLLRWPCKFVSDFYGYLPIFQWKSCKATSFLNHRADTPSFLSTCDICITWRRHVYIHDFRHYYNFEAIMET